MYLKFIALVFTLLIINKSILTANWDPELIKINEQSVSLNILKDPRLCKLETAVLHYSHNSWCSQEKAKMLFELITLTQPNVCVEIGAFTGASALPVIAALKFLGKGHGYIIDAWSNKESVKYLYPDDPNTKWWSQVDMNYVKHQCLDMIKIWSLNSYCTVIHDTSERSIFRFQSIDFLHLDGNFSEEGSLLDTNLYLPKVKPGGYILVSNVFMKINQKATKMKTIRTLFDKCEIVCELENSNIILFKKK